MGYSLVIMTAAWESRIDSAAPDYPTEACQSRRPDGTTDPLAVVGYNQAVPEANRFHSASPGGELGSVALCAACDRLYSTLLGMRFGCHRLARDLAAQQAALQAGRRP